MIYGLCKRGRLYEYNNVRDVIAWRATRCHFTAHCIDNDIRLAYDCRRGGTVDGRGEVFRKVF